MEAFTGQEVIICAALYGGIGRVTSPPASHVETDFEGRSWDVFAHFYGDIRQAQPPPQLVACGLPICHRVQSWEDTGHGGKVTRFNGSGGLTARDRYTRGSSFH